MRSAIPEKDSEIVVLPNPVSPSVAAALATAGFGMAAKTRRHTVYTLAGADDEVTTDLPRSDQRPALSVAEVAELLGISGSHAYELISTNVIPAVRLGRRIVVPRHAIDELLSARSSGT